MSNLPSNILYGEIVYDMDNDATQIKTWVQNAQTSEMRKGFAAALDSKVPFRHEYVREAIRAGVASYQQNRPQASKQGGNQ